MTKPLTQTIGRRKTSVARVRLYDGSGKMTLNDKKLEDFFPTMAQRIRVLEPMRGLCEVALSGELIGEQTERIATRGDGET